MNKDALALYQAELAARSIIERIPVTGDISQIANVCHKVRDSDIEAVLDAASNEKANSFSRLLGVIQIMLSGAGAYMNVQKLVASTDLLREKVMPHYSMRVFQLSPAAIFEPMNLYFGSAKENMMGNKVSFAPHQIMTFDVKGYEVSSERFNTTPKKESTRGDQIFQSFVGSPNIYLAGPQTPIHASKTGISITPYSAKIKSNNLQDPQDWALEPQLQANLGMLSIFCSAQLNADLATAKQSSNPSAMQNKAFDNERQRITHSLQLALRLFTEMTKAGVTHYDYLLKELRNRQDAGMHVIASSKHIIKKSREGWVFNRSDIEKKIVRIIRKLNEDSTHMHTLAQNKPNPNFFALGLGNNFWWS